MIIHVSCLFQFDTIQDISELENTVASLKCQFEKTLHDTTTSQKTLEENLVSTKHDLLRVQDQLAMAEKVSFQSLA